MNIYSSDTNRLSSLPPLYSGINHSTSHSTCSYQNHDNSHHHFRMVLPQHHPTSEQMNLFQLPSIHLIPTNPNQRRMMPSQQQRQQFTLNEQFPQFCSHEVYRGSNSHQNFDHFNVSIFSIFSFFFFF
jgi:hypothetical protein